LPPDKKKFRAKIKDILTGDTKLTFLVGAGCSVDPPSCLPDGYQMKNILLREFCAESELPIILKYNIRFEIVVQIIHEMIDGDFKIIDYYGLCDSPNSLHFFFCRHDHKRP
jgi:hypothetical protein